MVNYESSSEDRIEKSIIFSDEYDQVEIRDDKVLVNNKLYFGQDDFENIVVLRKDNVIQVSRTKGVVLRCDVANDVCSLKLSPFYAGRTMGLWSNFNNEHVDEMTEPNGKVFNLISILLPITSSPTDLFQTNR